LKAVETTGKDELVRLRLKQSSMQDKVALRTRYSQDKIVAPLGVQKTVKADLHCTNPMKWMVRSYSSIKTVYSQFA
jgi:hypothetical protein